MSKKAILFLFFLIVLCKTALPQTGLPVYKLHYPDFLVGSTLESDTGLCQSVLKKNIGDGEYFIYYDSGLTSLWMSGAIFENKLEGRWEFRNKENEVFNYKMFLGGKQMKMNLPDNTFAKIYLPNKLYEFRAYYISAINDTVTNSLVTLNTYSQMYEIRKRPRFEAIWTFHCTQEDSILLGGIYPYHEWKKTTTCRITENESKIELYPPRRNQFAFTQAINFPAVFPKKLKIGHKWEGRMHIPSDYWLKEWENTNFYDQVEIAGKRSYSFNGSKLECWIVKGSSSNPDLGTSYFEYLFNEEYGFVRMEWICYDKQKAVFELENLKFLE